MLSTMTKSEDAQGIQDRGTKNMLFNTRTHLHFLNSTSFIIF